MTRMTSLVLDGLHKSFGSVAALDGLQLDLAPGELITLLGPSGCGKTTALRIVAGFQGPDAGSVILDGRDITSTPPNRRDMGMVFQSYSLFPNMTALQNVEFGLRVRRRKAPERRTRATNLLEMVGLPHIASRYAHQLSGGQQQRVALARALAIEPRVLLLDEPLSALDAKVRLTLREEIRRIQLELGITTLYVTHDQEEALSISDRVAVMAEGRLQQVGTPREIYSAPANDFVAGFVGLVNRIPCKVTHPGSGLVEHGKARLRVPGTTDLPVGANTEILVRPEALVPIDHGGSPDSQTDESTLGGMVVASSFLGATTRLWIHTAGGSVVAADVPSSKGAQWMAGTAVTLRVTPGAARIVNTSKPGEPPDSQEQAPPSPGSAKSRPDQRREHLTTARG